METAKDILEKQRSNRNEDLWIAATKIVTAMKVALLPTELSTAEQLDLQEEWYDWLKEFTEKREKEIADKAWEASFEYYTERIDNLERGVHHTKAPAKETFMKSLFPLKEI